MQEVSLLGHAASSIDGDASTPVVTMSGTFTFGVNRMTTCNREKEQSDVIKRKNNRKGFVFW